MKAETSETRTMTAGGATVRAERPMGGYERDVPHRAHDVRRQGNHDLHIEPTTSDVMTMTSLIKPMTSFVRRPASTRIRTANNRPARNDFRLGHGKSGPRRILYRAENKRRLTRPEHPAPGRLSQTTAQFAGGSVRRMVEITNRPDHSGKDLLLAQFGPRSFRSADFGLSFRKVRAPIDGREGRCGRQAQDPCSWNTVSPTKLDQGNGPWHRWETALAVGRFARCHPAIPHQRDPERAPRL